MTETTHPPSETTRPRLPSPPAGGDGRPSEIAAELRRFHVGPPDGSLPDGELTSAAVRALADDEPGDPAAALLAAEGPLTSADEEDLRDGTLAGLFHLAARRRLLPRRDAFLLEIRDLARRLRNKLEVERGAVERREPGHLQQAISTAAAGHFDVGALSEMIGEPRGAARLGAEDVRRIEHTLAILETFSFDPGSPLVHVVHPGEEELDEPDLRFEVSEQPLAAALEILDREAAVLVDVFRATRVARLEVDNAYVAARHDAWLERFGSGAFSESELLLLPVVVALETVERLESGGLRALSRLLLSGRPVHAAVTGDPQRTPELDDSSASPARLEPAYLALGHRKAFVQQTSTGDPAHLVRGLLASLDHARPSVHVVDPARGREDATAARTALFARAHPRFRFDPDAGRSWAGRVDFAGNPDPEAPWPARTLACEGPEGGEEGVALRVTFADLLLGAPQYLAHFRRVPAGCPEEALVPLADWLALEPEEAAFHVPWIWALDGESALCRVAVTRRLAAVCQERLDFWHQLQELAGVGNEYVESAVRKTQRERDDVAGAERERVAAEHAAALGSAKREAVEQAMSRLARRLLEIDVAADPAPAAAAPSPPPAPPPPAPQADAAATVEPPPPAGDGAETWIDTPLCTSCNDCTAINPRVFVYDANKQALIADLHAGTYAQVVLAAEKCPARCIHPGEPWNADEPGLEKLVERARPFQ